MMSDTKKALILQSNYIPWKGYFDMIAAVDEFIIFDDAQFTKNDWRNRNQIKTPKGIEWISVPVGQDISRKINEVMLNDIRWQKKHWKTFQANYSKAPYFKEIAVWLEPLYMNMEHKTLSALNRAMIESICDYLKIKTRITDTSVYDLHEDKTQRLVKICQALECDEYISGPAAQDYMDESKFENANIKLTWFDYSSYPKYSQLWGEFVHGVSILDLLFNCGKDSHIYMKHVSG